jgi:hypothetical protein
LLRKIVGPKAEDERRLQKMICTPNLILLSVSRMMTRAGHVIRERRTKGLVVKTEGMRPLARNKL